MTPAPKPPRREKKARKPLPRNSKPIARSTRPIDRGGRPKAVNRQRKASAFAHAYHSRERVRFVNSLPCVYCVALSPFFAQPGTSENAHTGPKPGHGLKSHFTTIVPLCSVHHRRYDQRIAPLDDPKVRVAIEAQAPVTQAKFAAYVGELDP